MADTATTNFQYGSIALANVKTTSYREETVYDPSGVNVTYVKHLITVQGTLAKGLAPAESGEVAGDVMAKLRRYLNRSRRFLSYAMGGKKIVEVGSSASPDDPTANLDAANGPKCLWVNAVHIAEACITVEASFEVCLVPCTAATRSILSHRFAQKEDYDKFGYCTVTTTGVIVCRSDIEKTADQLLEAAGLPYIREGYARQGKTFMISDDGLRFSYMVTDREYHNRPPEGVIEADGQFAIITGVNGSAAYANVDLVFRGMKEISRRDLYLRASEVLVSKVRDIRSIDPKTKQPAKINTTVTQDLYENLVKLSAVVLIDENKVLQDRQRGEGIMNIDLFDANGFGWRPGGENTPDLPIPVNTRETYTDGSRGQRERRVEVLRDGQVVDMVRALFQEPCDSDLEVLVQRSTSPRQETTQSLLSGGVIGVANAIDGGAAGGAGIAAGLPGARREEVTAEFRTTTGVLPATDFSRIAGILSGDPAALSGVTGNLGTGVTLFQDREPSLMDQFAPPGGTGGEEPSPTFASLGGNPVDNVGTSARRTDPDDLAIPYSSYLVSIAHDYDAGIIGSRGAGPVDRATGRRRPNPTASVGNPMLTVVATWTAERIGGRPQIPDPASPDPNFVLLSYRVKSEEPVRKPSGEIRYVLTGTYVYFVREPELCPILEAYPPFLKNDLIADSRAGLGDGEYTKASGILFSRVRTLPAPPFFTEPELPPAAPPSIAFATPSTGLVDGATSAGTAADLGTTGGGSDFSGILDVLSGNIPPFTGNPGG